LQVPSNYDNTHPYRLVMAYHWFTGAGIEVVDCHSEGIDCYTTKGPFYGLWQLADSSTIFVAPDGTPAPTVQSAATANNNGSPKVTGSNAGWANGNGQDIKLTNDILKQVEADLCIDTSRIFANGFSYGGAMSYEIACDPSTVSQFRGVAIYSGSPTLSGCSAAGGKPTTPIATFLSHGNQDPMNPFTWGQQMRDSLAADNGCKTPSSPWPARSTWPLRACTCATRTKAAPRGIRSSGARSAGSRDARPETIAPRPATRALPSPGTPSKCGIS
jgi:poly(3-hydroxybutyrate) depolymerase